MFTAPTEHDSKTITVEQEIFATGNFREILIDNLRAGSFFLRALAFQRWFRIVNRPITKGDR